MVTIFQVTFYLFVSNWNIIKRVRHLMYTGSIQEKLKSLFLLNKKRLKKLLFMVYAGYALSASKTD